MTIECNSNQFLILHTNPHELNFNDQGFFEVQEFC